MIRSIILIAVYVPFISTAQYQIKGSVVKLDGSPIKAIVVQIKNQLASLMSSSTLTDSSGQFSLEVSEPGNYNLNFPSLFYIDSTLEVTISTENKTVFLQPIRLQSVSNVLKTVTVSAKKEVLQFKDDHLAFVPSADPSIGSRPISDILNYIPGLFIDAKNTITPKGQESVQVLVNGRIIRSPAGDYLAQLNADEVERIEVYDNSTRFAYIKAAVVINVILKTKQPKKLWNAAINASTLPKINPSADASFSLRKQRFYARLSHDVAKFRSQGSITRMSDTFHFNQDFNNRTQHQMSTARLGWDYYPDSANTLTIEVNYSRHTDGLKSYINVETTGEYFQNALQSSPIEKELSGFITYRKDQKQKGHKMLELGITRFNLLSQRNLPGLQLPEERLMNNHSVGFKAEYQKNIGKLKILNGVFGQFTQITDHIDTVSLSHVLKSKYLTKAITSYHELNWQQKKWNFSLGANVDFVDLKLNRSGKENFSYHQLYLNPSVRINNVKGKLRIALAYNRKYILPSTHLMFGQYSQYEYGRIMPGNYSLKPAIQDLVKVTFSTSNKATVLFELFYDLMQNPVMMLNRLNGTFITQQPENIKSRRSLGGVFSIAYSPVRYFNLSLNMNGRRSNYSFKEKTFVLNPITWFGSSTLINRFTVNKKLSLSFNTSLHNWQTALYRDMRSFLICAIQGNYKINTRLNMSFSINDLFNQSQFRYTGMIASEYYESGFTVNRMRNAFVSLRYQLINSSLEKKTSTLKSFMSE